MFTASSATAAANVFEGMQTVPLGAFALRQTGFSLGAFVIQSLSGGATIGDFLAFSSVSISVNNFSVNTAANPLVTGSITATVAETDLYPDDARALFTSA